MAFTCTKCGSDDVVIAWRDHKTPYETAFGTKVEDNEHMACSCRRCEYKWKEKPLDKREGKS